MVQPDGTTPDVSRLSWFDKYGKSVIAFLFVVWTVVAPLIFGDGKLEREEWIIIAIAVGNNIVVYIVPLSPAFKSVKSVVNVILVVLAAVQTVLLDGWQPDDWSIVLGALVAALGVTYAPAASVKQPIPVAVGAGSDK